MPRTAPHINPIKLIRNLWIPMSDGTKLAARLWLPEDADRNPVPAIIEYIPYRKDDAYADEDHRVHGWVASNGYACLRIDTRGAGDSDGLLLDEYLPQELQDGVEAINWIAAQPWCTGKVGMVGISWGGFNSLQIAALAPEPLKAIISVGSTDDRYADDIHYWGGTLFARYQLFWATTMLAYNARPGDPEVVGPGWRDQWMHRLENISPFIQPWMTHQRYDAYWKHGSVCENYNAMKCAVYMVGAWSDGYTNSVFRVLEGYNGPCKGLIGPWGHEMPHWGTPAPAIGFLQESVRWWDYWLKGIDNGIMAEPKLRCYMQEAEPPLAYREARAGRWVADAGWPAATVSNQIMPLGAGTLGGAASPSVTLSHLANLIPASDAGNWAGWGHLTDGAADQRSEDGQWLCFDSAPLDQPLDIIGYPALSLRVAADRPQANLIVRLCDIAPDGRSTLITRGALNLTHRTSRETPEALTPGQAYDVSVTLKCISYALPAGHRLRVAVSSSYWPWSWPSPELVTLRVETGAAAALHLPVRDRSVADPEVPAHFYDPLLGPGNGAERLTKPSGGRTHHFDIGAQRHTIRDNSVFFSGIREPAQNGLTYMEDGEDACAITDGDPTSATATTWRECLVERGDWKTRVRSDATMTSTATHFIVTSVIEAFEGETRVFARSWTDTFPRDHM
jgi:hypothetical protein